MTQEEAIKILRDVHDKALFSVRNALETLIPELAENEDERIRKDIIAFIKAVACKTAISEERESKWITYLEKQKEQRPTEWNEEDEAAYNAFMCEVVDEMMSPTLGQIKWLRGIRDRLKSLRPSWKPNKKQMDALWTAKSYYGRAWACDIQRSLESLYDDLEEQCK